MSKFVLGGILIATLLPIVIYLVFAKPQDPTVAPPLQQEEMDIIDATQEPREGDTAQCALCRQISNGESQTQCLKDFACTQ